MAEYFLSLDLFQTLADVNRRIPQIWQGAMGDAYSAEAARAASAEILRCFPGVYRSAVASPRFMNMAAVYTACARQAMQNLGLALQPGQVAYHIMLQHGYAPFYEEVPDALRGLSKKYRLVVCSDADHLMVDRLMPALKVERVFLSEDLQCYKGDPGGRFFRRVLSALEIPPNRLIHVGDSPADIQGARGAGVAACWLNRSAQPWPGGAPPARMLHSLRDLL
ncbi:MAG: HAD family hydrolase [Eubacteriales bacterium]|nr:HAD family hydrolase [Eubacteriales bacterium]